MKTKLFLILAVTAAVLTGNRASASIYHLVFPNADLFLTVSPGPIMGIDEVTAVTGTDNGDSGPFTLGLNPLFTGSADQLLFPTFPFVDDAGIGFYDASHQFKIETQPLETNGLSLETSLDGTTTFLLEPFFPAETSLTLVPESISPIVIILAAATASAFSTIRFGSASRQDRRIKVA